MDRKVAGCARRLVSNDWLAQRYGGTVLPHVRDTEQLDPATVERARYRAELGMDGRFWVGFVGTMRLHKGNRELVDAVSAAGDGVGLFLAGANPEERFAREVLAHARAVLGDERLRVVPVFPFDELPRWLALPDLIALPSLSSDAAVGQIPAKLFDAMAMGKPVISSSVNDAARILGDAGVIVPPGDVEALTGAIVALHADEARRQKLGSQARRRAEEHYSYRVGSRVFMQALAAVPSFPAAAV
jgi:glycosyltransferase involved in cell wall biosynthesis